MIRAFILAMVTALAPVTASADALSAAGGRYVIQPTSLIAFTVGQVGGGGLAGSFNAFSGIIDLDTQTLSKSSVSFTLKPASVETKQARIGDFLRSSAVFDVQNHPLITFRSTRIVQTGPSTARIDGVLTARGKTHGETFFALLTGHRAGKVSFHVTGNVLRSPYGMDVGTPIYSNVVNFDMELQGAK